MWECHVLATKLLHVPPPKHWHFNNQLLAILFNSVSFQVSVAFLKITVRPICSKARPCIKPYGGADWKLRTKIELFQRRKLNSSNARMKYCRASDIWSDLAWELFNVYIRVVIESTIGFSVNGTRATALQCFEYKWDEVQLWKRGEKLEM